MEIIKKEQKLCVCCMEDHEVLLVRVKEKNTFQEQELEYDVVYEYCNRADEYFATDEMLSENHIALRKAYRKKMGLDFDKNSF